MGGDPAAARMKRIVVNPRCLKPNLALLASESNVLDKESQPQDDLFVNRISVPIHRRALASEGADMWQKPGIPHAAAE